MTKPRKHPKSRPQPSPKSAEKSASTEEVAEVETIEAEAAALTGSLGAPPAPAEPQSTDVALGTLVARAAKALEELKGHLATAKTTRDAAERRARQVAEEADALQAERTALEEARRAAESRDASLAEREASVVARELDAERGFLAHKAEILGGLEADVSALRAQRTALADELRGRRESAEEEARKKVEAHERKWADAQKKRSEHAAKARLELDEALARDRETGLAETRKKLQEERERVRATLDAERSALDAEIMARHGALQAHSDALDTRERELRITERDLLVDQDLMKEEREALDKKVARLVAESTEQLRHELASATTLLKEARAQRDGYWADLEARRELDRRFGGRTPEEILAHLQHVERERDELTRQLRERPDERAATRLANLERERSDWHDQRASLEVDLANARSELSTRRIAAIELEGLRREKEALRTTNALLDQALSELDAKVTELTHQDDKRNPMTALTALDADEVLQLPRRTVAPLHGATPDLRAFAEDLRHRIAHGVEGRTLYYTAEDIRAFLGGLAMTQLMLLQGISGTGKTSLPLAFASAVGGDVEVVEVQAGWRDRQDLVGYYNAFHKHYYATSFLQALYRAGTPANKDRVFLMVLDEINLSRPEQFFADFLSALEQPTEKRRLTLVNDPITAAPKLLVDGRHLPIPPNVWFVGTANHDETTVAFADKTYDRAHVMEMPRNTDAARFEVEHKNGRGTISHQGLIDAFAAAAAKRSNEVEHATQWLRQAPFAETLGRRFRVGWGNRLEQQLGRYLPVIVEAGGSVGEAMDHLLVTKVFRKLADRHDVRAEALGTLKDELLTTWLDLDKAHGPERCAALLDREIEAKLGEDLA
ncbi:MAG: hypothetical protein EP329_08955 [Deltaproteobacteria bacterium]|nr:MAG: hypothetical protein EP329_08955 [Deltaproteobacteria bacterium]